MCLPLRPTPEVVAGKLRRLADEHAVIAVVGETAMRVDVVVTTSGAHARVVSANDAAGLLTWRDIHLQPHWFDGVEGGCIVVVNGPSGAGKPTLMGALQSLAAFPLVVFDEPEQLGTVQAPYLIWRDRAPAPHRGHLTAMAALAGAGNYVALSAGGHPWDAVAAVFAPTKVIAVGSTCDLPVLEQREQRTGRWGGRAAGSASVHEGWSYDVEFDTLEA
jgi:hypothetical protein